MTSLNEKYIFLHLSSPASVLIDDIREENGLQILYRSHVRSNSSGQKSFFRFNNKVYTQIDNQVYTSRYGIHEDVTIIAIQLSRLSTMDILEDIRNFIYDTKVQLKLHKQHLKFINQEAFAKKKERS